MQSLVLTRNKRCKTTCTKFIKQHYPGEVIEELYPGEIIFLASPHCAFAKLQNGRSTFCFLIDLSCCSEDEEMQKLIQVIQIARTRHPNLDITFVAQPNSRILKKFVDFLNQ